SRRNRHEPDRRIVREKNSVHKPLRIEQDLFYRSRFCGPPFPKTCASRYQRSLIRPQYTHRFDELAISDQTSHSAHAELLTQLNFARIDKTARRNTQSSTG